MNLTGIKLDEFVDLSSVDADLDGVVDLDERIRVTYGTAVAGNNARHSLQPNTNLLYLTQLVLGFLCRDSVNGKATLDVVDDTEVLVRLLNTHNVCR